MNTAFFAAIFALLAAGAWGSGDFTGGLVSRRVGPFHTILVNYSVGLFTLVVVALVSFEALPPVVDLVWGAVAGLLGLVGLGFLMRGFATGRMGIVAPVSAVLAAAIPVVFAALTEGLPSLLQLLGFGLALAGIWLLARPEPLVGRPDGLGMALIAGLGFGMFFTALSQVGPSAVFWPLVAGRLATVAFLVVMGLVTRRPIVSRRLPFKLLVLAGVLDVGGNLFFLLATQSGRLDVAAVLSSLYPAVTAVLAWLIAKEEMTRVQMGGVLAAVLAIVLITL